MYVNKIFQVRKVKTGYISLDFGIVQPIHICGICSMQCSSNGILKLFPWHISNSCRVLESLLKGKLYPEEMGTAFRLHHDETHAGLDLKLRASKDSIL